MMEMESEISQSPLKQLIPYHVIDRRSSQSNPYPDYGELKTTPREKIYLHATHVLCEIFI